MSKDIPMADILEWCKKRNYALVAREDFPYLFKDIVKCGECKWWDKSIAGHINVDDHLCRMRLWWTLETDFCSDGERKDK